MYKDKKVVAIIPAAGQGKRMGTSIPKQFLEIEGRPIYAIAASKFEENAFVDHIVVVTNEEYCKECRDMLALDYGVTKLMDVIPGGNERQDSVFQGLKLILQSTMRENIHRRDIKIFGEDILVLIHDGARPFVSQEVINQGIFSAYDKGAAVAAVPMKDTIKEIQRNEQGEVFYKKTLERDALYSIQTPQAFKFELILGAYYKAFEDGYYGTDDAVLVERQGIKVFFSQGDYKNKKITTIEDLPMEITTGMGYDVHKLVQDRKLILCGVEIPHYLGLLGHSDADVAIHAAMDALLGAAALGDIGQHFPDTKDKYKGISSLDLLRETAELLKANGFVVGNLDITIVAEKPKLAPHREAMRMRTAQALGTNIEKISVKATTTEGLGFEGKEEGISAMAVCTLYK